MRKLFCAWVCSLVALTLGVADGPKRKSTPVLPPDVRLNAVLEAWEQSTAARRDVQCEFQLFRNGPLKKTAKNVESGTMIAFRSDGTRIDLRDDAGKPTATYVWIDGQLRHFDYKTKIEYVFAPAKNGSKPKFNPLAGVADKLSERMAGLPERFRFGLFGMTASEAKSRFKIKLLHEDSTSALLSFEPMLEQDRQDVKLVELALDKADFRPSRAEIQSVIGTKFIIVPMDFQSNCRPGAIPLSLAENVPTGWKRHFPLGGKTNALQNAN